MGIDHLNLKPVVAACVVILALCGGAGAQEARAPDESALLSALSQATPAEAARIDRELQALWSHSGSDAMDLLLKRGREALERGDPQAAIEHLTALTDHAPDFAEAWHLRASAWFELGRYGLAAEDLGRALTLNPNNYNALFGLASVLETIGDDEKAYEAYARVKAIHPNFEEVTKALDRLRPRVTGKEL